MGYSRDELVSTVEEASRGALLLFGGQTISAAIGAAASIAVARLLGPELYGVYALCFVVPNLLILATDLGVGPALTRFSAKLKAEGQDALLAGVIRCGLAFRIATTLAVLALALIASDELARWLLKRAGLSHLVRLSLLLLFFNSLVSAANAILVGFNDMQGSAKLSILLQSSKAATSVLLVVLGFGVLGALAGQIAGFAIAATAGIAMVFLKHYRGLRVARATTYSAFELIRMILGYGVPLYVAGAIGGLLASFQTVVLAWFTTNDVIGNFTAAMRVSSLIGLLVTPISIALFPAFSKLEEVEAKRLFYHAVRYTTMVIVPATVLLIALSPEIVFTLYGEEYTLAPRYLALYAVSFLYAGIGSTVYGIFYQGIGRTDMNLKTALLYALLFVPASIAFTKSFGAEGLILSHLMSSLAAVLYGVVTAIRTYNVALDPKGSILVYLSSGLSAIPISALTLWSSLHYIVKLATGTVMFVLLYLTLVPLLGGINQSDLDRLREVFGKASPLRRLVDVVYCYESKIIELRHAASKRV